MIQINDELLDELGLNSLPEEEKQKIRRQIYETLEMRVGMNLASQMTDDQLSDFDGIANKGDDKQALEWLEANFPEYKKVVDDEFMKLKVEIKSDSKKIIDSLG